MVSNQEVKQEFDLFADIWKMFKFLLPVGNKDDVEYWDKVNQMVADILNRYPGAFGKALAFAVLEELERRSEIGEG